MKSILYITNIPAPYTVEFFNDLGKHYELTVVFEGKKSEERDKSWEHCQALAFKYCILDGDDSRNGIKAVSEIKKKLNERQYDLYIIGNYSSVIGMTSISWLRRKKYPYAIHADGGMISNDSLFKFLIKKHFIGNAELYFSSGRKTTEYFVHYGADKSKVHVYPFSSVRENQIRKELGNDIYRQKLGLDPDQNIIVSVGQIIPRKGFDVLIRAMSLVKTNAKLYIIGGEATDDLSALIDELGITSIEFIPFVPFETILDYLAASDLFVLLTREDIWGLVINEALSMGAPVISTDKCVAALEMVENGINGFVIENENYKQAADRIDFLLSNSDLRHKMQIDNIAKARQYTIEAMCMRYCEIINDFFESEGKK